MPITTGEMKKMFARAFEEWERRWREEPDRFMADTERLAIETASIGQQQAEYFTEILCEISESDASASGS